MAALSVALAFAKTIFGGVPLWVWPLIAVGLFAGLQTIRLEHAKTAIAQGQAQYATYQKQIAQATASANAKAIADQQAIQAQQDAAVTAKLARLQNENDALNKRLQEIADAPADQDGPVAPVLRDTLERLWR